MPTSLLIGEESTSIHIDRSLLILLFVVVAAVAVAHRAGDKYFDFGVFYYAAHMIPAGVRHALYDLPTQHAFQAKFHRPETLLFCYPPFVLIPFLGIAWLPIEAAFVIWTILSLALLIFCVRTLSAQAGLRYGNWPILLSLVFMPVASCLGHGQLSLLVLTAYMVTFCLWRKGRSLLGGAVLAIATFKFQLVLGFVAVLLVKRKWRELLGFAFGSTLFLVISVWMIGVHEFLRYPLFLLQGGGDTGSEPDKMANWRGLLSLAGGDHPVAVATLSVLTIVFAARLWRDLDTGFCAALLTAMLVSYHFGPQDLSLFLIPAFLSVRIGFPRERLVPLALSALLIPEVLALFGSCYALLAIPLGVCLWWIWQQERTGRTPEIGIAPATP